MPVNTEGKKQIFKTKTEIIFLTHLFFKKKGVHVKNLV